MKIKLLVVGIAGGSVTTIRAVSQTTDDDPTDAALTIDDAVDLDSIAADAVAADEVDLSSVDSGADDLSCDIRKLRREADFLDAEDFARPLKRLETNALLA